MPISELNFCILEVARDFLFVEDTDFYPAEIWEGFEEALYLFLTDNEIEVLNYRYGTEEFCSFSVDKRRSIMSDLVLRFNRSEFCAEMDTTMKALESVIFSMNTHSHFIENSADTDAFVKASLAKIGLSHLPGAIGECNFDSQIGNFPVYVWRSSEVAMPRRVLQEMLDAAVASGFARFFVVAQPRLTAELPVNMPGYIPYAFIPLLNEAHENSGFATNVEPLMMS